MHVSVYACHLSLLLTCWSSSSLSFAFGIDLRGEWILIAQRNAVYHRDPNSQQQTSRLSKEQRCAEEAHGRTPVHGRTAHIEGEPGDHVVHQDAKVVTEEGAGDTEGPGARQHQDIAARDQGVRRGLGIDGEQQRVRGLLRDGGLVEPVADDAQGEDGRGEGVAASQGVAAEELCQDFVVVFLASDDTVPYPLVLALQQEVSLCMVGYH